MFYFAFSHREAAAGAAAAGRRRRGAGPPSVGARPPHDDPRSLASASAPAPAAISAVPVLARARAFCDDRSQGRRPGRGPVLEPLRVVGVGPEAASLYHHFFFVFLFFFFSCFLFCSPPAPAVGRAQPAQGSEARRRFSSKGKGGGERHWHQQLALERGAEPAGKRARAGRRRRGGLVDGRRRGRRCPDDDFSRSCPRGQSEAGPGRAPLEVGDGLGAAGEAQDRVVLRGVEKWWVEVEFFRSSDRPSKEKKALESKRALRKHFLNNFDLSLSPVASPDQAMPPRQRRGERMQSTPRTKRKRKKKRKLPSMMTTTIGRAPPPGRPSSRTMPRRPKGARRRPGRPRRGRRGPLVATRATTPSLSRGRRAKEKRNLSEKNESATCTTFFGLKKNTRQDASPISSSASRARAGARCRHGCTGVEVGARVID